MRKTDLYHSVIALGLYACTAIVSADSAFTGSNNPPSGQQQRANLLERDPRLQQRVSVQQSSVTIASLLRRLSRETGVPLRAEAGVGGAFVTATLTNRPLRDVMDALGAVQWTNWEKIDDEYLLRNRVAERFPKIPDNSARRALTKNGLQFADAAAREFSPQQLSWMADTEIGYNMPFDKLSPRMQSALRQILAAEFERQEIEEPEREHLRPVQPDELAGSKVLFKQRSRGGVNFYSIGVGNERGGLTMLFDDRAQARQQYIERVNSPFTYWPAAATLSGQEAVQDKRLAQPVSLNVRRVRLEGAVQTLARQVSAVGFIVNGKLPLWETRNFALPTMPLHDALNRITRAYPFRVWELRPKSGVVVVRWARENEMSIGQSKEHFEQVRKVMETMQTRVAK